MKRSAWAREKARERYDKGYGRGEFATYRPWIEPKDFSSQGTSRRAPGASNGRHHSLFSDHEWRVFLACQHLRDIIDIREQFPLWELSETEAIAANLGFRHPGPIGADPQVMTTDFLLTMRDKSLAAIAVKPSKDLDDERVLQKLEIERRYWGRRDVPWSIVTERDIPTVLAANLQALVGWHIIPPDTMPANTVVAIEAELLALIQAEPSKPLGAHCREIDGRFGVKRGWSLSVAKHALACRRWETKLDVPIDGERPLPLLHPMPALPNAGDDVRAGVTVGPVPPGRTDARSTYARLNAGSLDGSAGTPGGVP